MCTAAGAGCAGGKNPPELAGIRIAKEKVTTLLRSVQLALLRKSSYSMFMTTVSTSVVTLILRSGSLLDLLLLRPART